MKKRTFLAAICLCLTASAAFAQQKPNIILVLTDDMGVGDIACYGGSLVPTPHLDRMAAEGIRFTQYYSASPICSPSRAGLLTGSYPARWNITSYLQTRKGNAACEQADFLRADVPTVAKLLKSAGYHTGHFGKWHLGGGRDVKNAPSIQAYGFDEYSSTWESPDPDPLISAENWIWSKTDSVKRWDRTGYFVDRTLAFLAKHKGQPCFINLWPDDVHTPWVADEKDMQRYPEGAQGRRQFEAVMKNYDRQMGRLMEGLKKLGIDQHTIVVFTSDNGALPTFDTRSGQYRGSKLSLYEGGIRMPLIVRYPGATKGGRVDSVSILSATDMLPTFCKLAGVKQAPQPAVDGVDRADVLLGKPSPRERTLFWEYGRNDSTFGYPRGKNRSPSVAVRQGKWKLLVNANGAGAELYDLEKDPGEQHDLSRQHPAETAQLTGKALAWFRALPALRK